MRAEKLKYFILFICVVIFQPFCYATQGTYDPSVINRENILQLKDEEIDRKFIDTADKDIQAEKKRKETEKQLKHDVVVGNLTYNPQFTLNKVYFEGNTVISDKKLQKLAAPLVGKSIYLEDLLNLVLKVSRYYQKQGYITSYAYVDSQEIVDGVVTIKIHESRVSLKTCEGNRWEKDAYLNNILMSGRGLNHNTVFNTKSLQGAMKTLNKETYMRGAASISRDRNKNTEINLQVEDKCPWKLSMSWDDFGRNYTGRQRFTSIIGSDNLTGFGDKIYGGAILAKDATGVLAGYDIPISKWGTRLGFDYSYSKMELGGPYRNYRINGASQDYIIRLTQPIKNTANQEIYASAAFDWLSSSSQSKLFGSLSDYKLRVLRLAVQGVFDDSKGRTLGRLGVDIGLGGLGATANIADGPQSEFYKVVANAARIQRLPKGCLGILSLNGQYSPQSLYPAEQMFLGGAYSIRGYQPSELIGDYGVAGTLELRTPVPGIKALFPKKYEDDWANRVKFVLFYDWGFVKEHNHLYDYPSNFLHSVGFGTNIDLFDAITCQVGVGLPLGQKNYGESDARMYFLIRSDFDRFFKPKSTL